MTATTLPSRTQEERPWTALSALWWARREGRTRMEQYHGAAWAHYRQASGRRLIAEFNRLSATPPPRTWSLERRERRHRRLNTMLDFRGAATAHYRRQPRWPLVPWLHPWWVLDPTEAQLGETGAINGYRERRTVLLEWTCRWRERDYRCHGIQDAENREYYGWYEDSLGVWQHAGIYQYAREMLEGVAATIREAADVRATWEEARRAG